ncbi:cell wall hydrolase [Paracoccus sp. DMF-8]|uniref:cell wall hydrolase n=1 Tax=Paracoccus sp. DMF-8 TaxID=3019445 RepID=UPI0023E45B24|nr:cell wall hydrolase [Paracoccus sp. DMF-8]MDF3607797.1 cell wall hydrolase [Paracoccus sp. DMF-8]
MTISMAWQSGALALFTAIALSISAVPGHANGNDTRRLSASNGGERVQQVAARGVSQAELQCLDRGIGNFEARGVRTAGQQAVAEVILNRVDHPRFPNSVCGVVNQRGQFSCKGRVSGRYNERAAFSRVQRVAMAALSGAPRDLTGGATYFHTLRRASEMVEQVSPRTVRIGRHIFYRSGGQRVASN